MTKRILVWVGALVALAVVGVAVYVARTWDRVYDAPLPDVQASSEAAESTPDRRWRGKRSRA